MLVKMFPIFFKYIWFRYWWIYKTIFYYCNLRKLIGGCWCKVAWNNGGVEVTLQKNLSIKVEEELEILAGSNMRGDTKLDGSVSPKSLTVLDVSYSSKFMYVKMAKKKKFLWGFLIELYNDSIKSFVKLFTCRGVNISKNDGRWLSTKNSNLPGL